MSEFTPKSLCVLGRQPEIGLAELESLYGAGHIRRLENAVLLDIDVNEIDFKRLGGTIKLARVLNILPTASWAEVEKYLLQKIPEHLVHVPQGKFTLGLSLYGLPVSAADINQSALVIKRSIRQTGRPVRVVPNKSPALSSAQVLHNKLTTQGAWELLVVADGQQIVLAQTIFVQDIEAYAARDQKRPKRDSRIGMLPPKLAQIIVNLANPPVGAMILDPFCGTGVVLQEALLMGYKTLGTDLQPRMIEFTETNLKWLEVRYPAIANKYEVCVGDATNMRWPGEISAVVSETYLGRPLTHLPSTTKMNEIVRDVNTILEKSLRNLASQLKSGTPLCLAVPAWINTGGKFITLPLIDRLTDLGYNWADFEAARPHQLIYWREGQTVARQLLVLKKA